MITQISTNNIESYIADLLDDQSSGDQEQYCEQIGLAEQDRENSAIYVEPELFVLPDDDKYLSFAVAGSDFLIAANQVVSVKSSINKEGYRDYHLCSVDTLLKINRAKDSGPAQFILILRGDQDYAICVDTVHGLVEVPAERLLIRKNIKDRPWYTAISRDFQSALLNSYTLGRSLQNV